MRVSKGGQREGWLPTLRDASLRDAPQGEVDWFHHFGVCSTLSDCRGNPAVSRAGDDTVLDDSDAKTALLRDAG